MNVFKNLLLVSVIQIGIIGCSPNKVSSVETMLQASLSSQSSSDSINAQKNGELLSLDDLKSIEGKVSCEVNLLYSKTSKVQLYSSKNVTASQCVDACHHSFRLNQNHYTKVCLLNGIAFRHSYADQYVYGDASLEYDPVTAPPRKCTLGHRLGSASSSTTQQIVEAPTDLLQGDCSSFCWAKMHQIFSGPNPYSVDNTLFVCRGGFENAYITRPKVGKPFESFSNCASNSFGTPEKMPPHGQWIPTSFEATQASCASKCKKDFDENPSVSRRCLYHGKNIGTLISSEKF